MKKIIFTLVFLAGLFSYALSEKTNLYLDNSESTLSVSVGPDISVCMYDTAKLNATAANSKGTVTYTWKSNGITKAMGASVMIRITNTMTIICYAVDDNQITATDTIIVTAEPLPDIMIGDIPQRCIDGSVIRLDDYVVTNPVNATREWSSPGHGITTGNLFMPIAAGVGKHKVVLTATNSATGCINTASSYVTINGIPSVNAGFDDTLCTGDIKFDLNGYPDTPIGQWRNLYHPGKGVTQGIDGWYFDLTQNDIANYLHSLVYNYTDTNGCSNEDTMNLEVYHTPYISLVKYDDMCIDDGPINLNGQPAGGNWTGPGIFGKIFDPGTAGSGSHEMVYTIKNGICISKDTTIITVRPLPSVSSKTVSDKTIFCNSDGWIELEGTPSGGIWSGSSFLSGNYFNTEETKISSTAYDLSYTFTDSFGCSNSSMISLTVRPKPEVIIDESSEIYCFPEDNYEANANYKFAEGLMWFKDNDSASGSFSGNPINSTIGYNPGFGDKNRKYFILYVKTTHSDSVCPIAFDTVKVNMGAMPEVNYNIDVPTSQNLPLDIMFLDSTFIDPYDAIASRLWAFGDGQFSNLLNPIHQYTKKGTYYTMLKVTSQIGCIDSIVMAIIIGDNGVGMPENKSDDINIYPNPSNGIFYINANKISALKVFDSKGRLMFQENNGSFGNNYQIDLSDAPKGVYILQITDNSSQIFYTNLILE
jgi:hypothetical protein